MAEARFYKDQDELNCPVCLDLLKNPVTINCGHNFCMECINIYWDQTGVYCCPQCRQAFTPRPVLHRNNMLAEMVEKLTVNAGSADLQCGYCTERKEEAIKSCLTCMVSYCETHLKPHLTLPVLKNHKLVDAVADLQEQLCSQHGKLLEIFCQTDQSCICYLCMVDNHKDHKTVSVAAQRNEKQNQAKELQRNLQQGIQQKQKTVNELKESVITVKSSAQKAVEESEKTFEELIRFIQRKQAEVSELIRAQEKSELSQAEQLLEKLEKEISDLKQRATELEEIIQTEDHIRFLQSFMSVGAYYESDTSPAITANQHLSFDEVKKAVSELKIHVEEFVKEEFNKIPCHLKDAVLLNRPATTVDTFSSLSELENILRLQNMLKESPQRRASANPIIPSDNHDSVRRRLTERQKGEIINFQNMFQESPQRKASANPIIPSDNHDSVRRRLTERQKGKIINLQNMFQESPQRKASANPIIPSDNPDSLQRHLMMQERHKHLASRFNK
ncbi:E3 ubiquitin/ISG15 ligase TRIM25-like [Trichomycterus rosablanca]|uniref:E3 ubiquitin/ISG15 ligase TRIM25-like n=1 Tax=Trichomycterus rosablanca TaxID=2290929 RepID=UPI002F357B45